MDYYSKKKKESIENNLKIEVMSFLSKKDRKRKKKELYLFIYSLFFHVSILW